jgi:hypothetical protein
MNTKNPLRAYLLSTTSLTMLPLAARLHALALMRFVAAQDLGKSW